MGKNAGHIKEQGFLFIIKKGFTGELTEGKLNYLAVYFIIISILELLAYLFRGIFSLLASRVWSATGIICFFAVLAYFIKAVFLDLKENKYLAFISVIFLVFVLIYVLGSPEIGEINPDAAQQAAAGFNSFNFADLNYTGKSFLGYPNRQYIITALPALLLGRNIFSLHLGFAFPFILGIFLLYSAFRRWARKLGLNTETAVIPLFALFVFPYITEYYANFEQAIYPVSFTMLAIGFFLLLLCEPKVLHILCLAWIGGLLSNSYTPALAALGLLLVFLALSAYLWLRRPSAMPFEVSSPLLAAEAFLLAESNIMLFFLAELVGNGQDNITGIRSGGKLFAMIGSGIYNFLTDKNAVFLGMFGVPVIIYLMAGLTLRLKKRDLLVSLWVLGVIAAGDLLTGYTSYEPAWIMQRAMIVIPVIITAVTVTVFELLDKRSIKISKEILIIILAAFTFIGLGNFHRPNQSFTYFNYVQPVKYMWYDLEKAVKDEDLKATSKFNLILYSDNILFKNLKDYSAFLYPNINIYFPENGKFPEDIDLRLETFIYGDNGLPVSIPVNAEKEAFSYKNVKHGAEGMWYKELLR